MRSPALLLTLAGLAGGAGLAATAQAATYQVTACASTPGAAVNRLWVPVNTSPGTIVVTATCPPRGSSSGLLIEDIEGGSDTPGGAQAEWVFVAPAGTSVVGLSANQWLRTQGDRGWVAYFRDAAGTLLASCQGAFCLTAPLDASGNPVPSLGGFSSLRTPVLAFGVACVTATPCINGTDHHNVGASVQGPTVTLDDPALPEFSAVAGGLTDETNWLRGTQSLEVTTIQGVSGVSRIALRIDAQEQPGSPVTLACDYTRALPCPQRSSASFVIDTARLADGTRTTELSADNASATVTGRMTRSWLIRVDNQPPSPLDLATPRVQAKVPFGAAWRDSQPGGAPVVRADWSLQPLDGGPGARAGSAADPNGVLASLVVPRAGLWTLAVALTDAAGNTGAAQALRLLAHPAPPRISRGRVLVPIFPALRARRFELRLTAARRTRYVRFARLPAGRRLLVFPIPTTIPRTARTLRPRWRLVGARHFESVIVPLPRPPGRQR